MLPSPLRPVRGLLPSPSSSARVARGSALAVRPVRAPVFPQRNDWPALHGPVRALLSQEPFRGRAAIERVRVHAARVGLGVLACVPARDEADRLPRTLDALAASLAQIGEPTGILVLVNNASDGSASAAWEWARNQSLSVAVVEAHLDSGIADAGHARRLALDLGSLVVRTDAVLLTTDADTRVARDWAPRLVRHIRAGAGCAAGMIDVEPSEFAELPKAVHEVERTERALFREHARTWRLIVPDEPLALALRVGGASLGVSASAYRRVGGLPALSVCEDRAMVARMIEYDERVVFDERATIRTSCRLEGRAQGGMAGMLMRRVREPDPHCDEALHTAHQFAALCLAWRCLREGWDAAMRLRIADLLGCDPDDLVADASHGQAWTRLLAALPATERLRASDVRSELARSRALRGLVSGDGPRTRPATLLRRLEECQDGPGAIPVPSPSPGEIMNHA